MRRFLAWLAGTTPTPTGPCTIRTNHGNVIAQCAVSAAVADAISRCEAGSTVKFYCPRCCRWMQASPDGSTRPWNRDEEVTPDG